MALAALGAACGRDDAAGERVRVDESAIINGEPDGNESVVTVSSSKGLCTGTFVSKRVVLTAAHCVAGAGNVAVTWFDGTVGAESSAAHPEFNGDLANGRDVGVVVLPPGRNTPAPVPMFASALDDSFIMQTVRAIGFGKDKHVSDGPSYGARLGRTLPVLGLGQFHVILADALCFGDSGGPLLLNGAMIGVASGVDNENCSGRSYYSRIDTFRYWVTTQVAKAGDAPSRNSGDIGIPTLMSPPDGSVLPAHWTSVVLMWNAAPNAAGYSVRVEDRTTNTMLLAVDQHPTTDYSLSGLQSGHRYDFWVRADASNFRAGDESTYTAPSEKNTFTVAERSGERSTGTACVPNTIVGVGGKVMDASGRSSANGTRVELWDALQQDNQEFTVHPDGTIRGLGGKCVDVSGINSADGTPIQLWDCWGGPNEQWAVQADGSIRGLAGKCIDVANGSSANGAGLILNTCNGSASQRWRVCSASGSF